MQTARLESLCATYRDGLLQDTLSFWFPRCIDRDNGGFFTALDRDGALVDTDKCVWQQGRAAWLLATLYNTVGQRPEWLEAAQQGITFMQRHCFDTDGRMFFQVTCDGKPLRKRRYVFSEAFAAIAWAAWAKAMDDNAAAEQAHALFTSFLRYNNTPGLLPAKVVEETRPTRGLAIPMITMNIAQNLRDTIGHDDFCNTEIDRCIAEIETFFMKPEMECVLETVGSNGEFIDHYDGRTVNPGHAIEAAWFILHEARTRGNDPALIRVGCQILDWMWARGWDKDYGGILYFVDVKELPVQEYWHDMKFWWPHNETIIATLLAYHLTGEEKYAQWHQQVHDWAYGHFPDTEHGEWYGYLHRDGRISTQAKGTMWKGPFHLPRMQLYCWKLIEEMRRLGEAASDHNNNP